MGGCGSGGQNSRGRMIAEGAMTLDVRELRRHGSLVAGRRGFIEWTRGSGSKSSVGYAVRPHQFELRYNLTDNGAQPHRVTDWVGLHWRPCRFGGNRPTFVCQCGAEAMVLYFRGGRFQCRQCARVAYASQNEGPRDRTIRRARKIRYRLGGGPSLVDPVPGKPKGMWWRTYDRLTAELIATEGAAVAALLPIVQRLKARLGG